MANWFGNIFPFLRGDTQQEVVPSEKELNAGSIGWSDYSNFLQDAKYNPDDLIGRKGFPIYKNMLNDEQVKSAVHFKRSTVTGRDWYFYLDHDQYGISKEEAERRIDIYTDMLENCYAGALSDGLNAIEKSIWQGFSMTEKIFSQFQHDKKTYWGLNSLKPKPFETFHPIVDEMGQVKRWVQRGGMGTREIKIDLSKFVYHRHNPDLDEHYGRSELRAAYRAYISKDVAIKYANVYLERLAGGFPVAKPAEGRSITRGSQEWMDLVSLMRNITGKSSIILPEGIDLEIVSTNGSSVDVFTKLIELHDLAIAKALLMPNLLGMSHSGQTGSYSQSETQFDVFMIVSDDESNRLADTLNEQVFSPLGKINFADGISPRFGFKPLSRRKMQGMLSIWKELLAAGAVEASDTDEDHIRDLIDFPAKGEPIKEPVPVVPKNTPPTDDSDVDDGEPNAPIGQGEEEPDREEIKARRKRFQRMAASFQRAEQRVSFAVIDRQSSAAVAEYAPQVEDAVAAMTSWAVEKIEEDRLGSNPDTSIAISRFDVDGFKVRVINTKIRRSLNAGMGIGNDHARREIDKAKKERFQRIDMDRLGELAEEYMKSKSFVISGDVKSGVVREIKTVLMNAIKYSWGNAEIKRAIYKTLAQKGYLSGVKVGEALGISDLRALAQELELTGGLTAHRLDTIIRTNMFEAINEARFNYFTDPELDGFVVALEYSAILDSKTTAICTHLDGKVYAADNREVWNTYRPPNHFNCRSLVIPVTEADDDVSITPENPGIQPQAGFGS